MTKKGLRGIFLDFSLCNPYDKAMAASERNYYYRKPRKKKKKTGFKRWLFRGMLIAFLVLFLYLFLGGPYGLIRIITLYTNVKTVGHKTDRLIVEKVLLSKQCDKLKNDLFTIEKIAREKLGMIKDGEIVYKIIREK
jgi:cell division protein FtsB